MPIKYVDGKKIHLPYPKKKKNTVKKKILKLQMQLELTILFWLKVVTPLMSKILMQNIY